MKNNILFGGALVVAFLIIFVFGIIGVASLPNGGGPATNNEKTETADSIPTETQIDRNTTEPTTNTQTQTPLPETTEQPTKSPTPTMTRSPTSTDNEESPDSLAVRRIRYSRFMDIYTADLTNSGINVSNYSLDPKNESATVTWIEQANNRSSHIKNRQTATILYADATEVIRESENASVKVIPKTVNFVILTKSGENYLTTHITYLDAWEYTEGSINIFEYQAIYIDNSEYGPAHPEYEGNETATATAVSS
jgi:hypothetical protein